MFSVLVSWVLLQDVVLHSRYADLKQVVLDELLAQHGDTELDAQLHEAAGVGTLERKTRNTCQSRMKSTRGRMVGRVGRGTTCERFHTVVMPNLIKLF